MPFTTRVSPLSFVNVTPVCVISVTLAESISGSVNNTFHAQYTEESTNEKNIRKAKRRLYGCANKTNTRQGRLKLHQFGSFDIIRRNYETKI